MKGISNIFSAIIIIILGITLFTTAYSFGFPQIQKIQDEALFNQADEHFNPSNPNSLTKKIIDTANTEGETLFSTTISGLWKLFSCADKTGDQFLDGCGDFGFQNNSIEFSFISNSPKYEVDKGWSILYGSANSCPPSAGSLGVSGPAVVCVRIDSRPDGLYNVSYRLWFRELVDPTGDKFKISLHNTGKLSSTEIPIKISFDRRRTELTADGKNLIVAQIKIQLA